jgi:hypothetical protein
VSAAVALSDDDRSRLIRLCGMLTSSYPAERSAAALKASQLLARCQTTWEAVLTPEPATVPAAAALRTWRDVADLLLVDHYAALRPKEPAFLASLIERARAPTEKQELWLRGIASRCGVPAWDIPL